MSLYEELNRKYPSQVVEPFKEPVLIIGVKDFKSEWEEQLKAEGCKVLVSDYLGKSCFLIRKPQNSNGKSENKAENGKCEVQNQTLEEKDKEAKPKQYRKPWSREDEAKLIQLYNEGKSYEELSKIFGRTKKALMQKIYDLGLHRQVEVKQLNLAKPKMDKPINDLEISNMKNCNGTEVKELLEASIMLLPTHRQAAIHLIRAALNQLQNV
ncbi:MAG: hypothetical protein QXF44_03475 [Candidatus Bathyarchaeia archaeon]